MIRSLWRELPLLVDKAVPNIDIDNSCLLKQWADAAAADKAAAAAGAATAANSAAEKRRLGSLFTIWQCAGTYRRVAAHQRCGRARIESPGGAPPGLFHRRPAKLCPFSAIPFRSRFAERS